MSARQCLGITPTFLALLIVVVGCALRKKPTAGIQVDKVEGRVAYQKGKLRWGTLSSNLVIFPGTKIRTESGTLRFSFTGQSCTNVLLPNSELELVDAKQAQTSEGMEQSYHLKLNRGKLAVRTWELKPKDSFHVETPVAVTGVRSSSPTAMLVTSEGRYSLISGGIIGILLRPQSPPIDVTVYEGETFDFQSLKETPNPPELEKEILDILQGR